MNLFKENKIKILANISAGFLLLLVLISFAPALTFADTSFGSSYRTTSGASYSVGSGNSGVGSCGGGGPRTFCDLIVNTIIGGVLTPIITLIVSGAVVVFLWGVFKFIKSEGKEKEAGKDMMVWGIVGIFVMVSVWGLVNILRGTFNLDNTQVEINNILP
jgi:hypothetical protein